jgi:hypothetical protein
MIEIASDTPPITLPAAVEATVTPLPTLPGPEAKVLVEQLLLDNSNCQLPCWWRFVPGQSTMQEIQQFHRSLNSIVHRIGSESDPSYQVDVNLGDGLIVNEWYSSLDGNGVLSQIFVGGVVIIEDRPGYGDPRFQHLFEAYTLPSILNAYGTPDQVNVTTDSSAPQDGPLYYRINLFYRERSFMVEYSGVNERRGDTLLLCPQRSFIALWLWPPDEMKTIEQVVEYGPNIGPDDFRAYVPIGRVNGMTIDEFYKTFSDASYEGCLETNASLW